MNQKDNLTDVVEELRKPKNETTSLLSPKGDQQVTDNEGEIITLGQ